MAIKIPESFGFGDKSALIIVAGAKAAKIYAALGGMMDEVADIPAAEIHYTDKEGFFASSGSGQSFGSGATSDRLDEKEKAEFKINIESALSRVWQPSFTEIYLLSPEWNRETVIGALPPGAAQAKITNVAGNFVKRSPLEILEIIIK